MAQLFWEGLKAWYQLVLVSPLVAVSCNVIIMRRPHCSDCRTPAASAAGWCSRGSGGRGRRGRARCWTRAAPAPPPAPPTRPARIRGCGCPRPRPPAAGGRRSGAPGAGAVRSQCPRPSSSSPSCISSSGSGTRSLSGAPSGSAWPPSRYVWRMHCQYLFYSNDCSLDQRLTDMMCWVMSSWACRGTGWSGTPSPAPPAGCWCKPSSPSWPPLPGCPGGQSPLRTEKGQSQYTVNPLGRDLGVTSLRIRLVWGAWGWLRVAAGALGCEPLGPAGLGLPHPGVDGGLGGGRGRHVGRPAHARGQLSLRVRVGGVAAVPVRAAAQARSVCGRGVTGGTWRHRAGSGSRTCRGRCGQTGGSSAGTGPPRPRCPTPGLPRLLGYQPSDLMLRERGGTHPARGSAPPPTQAAPPPAPPRAPTPAAAAPPPRCPRARPRRWWWRSSRAPPCCDSSRLAAARGLGPCRRGHPGARLTLAILTSCAGSGQVGSSHV